MPKSISCTFATKYIDLAQNAKSWGRGTKKFIAKS